MVVFRYTNDVFVNVNVYERGEFWSNRLVNVRDMAVSWMLASAKRTQFHAFFSNENYVARKTRNCFREQVKLSYYPHPSRIDHYTSFMCSFHCSYFTQNFPKISNIYTHLSRFQTSDSRWHFSPKNIRCFSQNHSNSNKLFETLIHYLD